MNKFRKTMVLFSILLMASCHQQTPGTSHCFGCSGRREGRTGTFKDDT